MEFKNSKTLIDCSIRMLFMIALISTIVIVYLDALSVPRASVYTRNLIYVLGGILAIICLYLLRYAFSVGNLASAILADRRRQRKMFRGTLMYASHENKAFRSRYKVYVKDVKNNEKIFFSEAAIPNNVGDFIYLLYGEKSNYIFKFVKESADAYERNTDRRMFE